LSRACWGEKGNHYEIRKGKIQSFFETRDGNF